MSVDKWLARLEAVEFAGSGRPDAVKTSDAYAILCEATWEAERDAVAETQVWKKEHGKVHGDWLETRKKCEALRGLLEQAMRYDLHICPLCGSNRFDTETRTLEHFHACPFAEGRKP